MDAQNAAESDQTRPAGTSPRQRRSSTLGPKSPAAVRASSPSKDTKLKSKPSLAPSGAARPDDASEDRDSDAETIVLPGKDGHSPSKARKVRQEDKGESDGDATKGNGHSKAPGVDGEKVAGSGSRAVDTLKKKRLSGSGSGPADKDRQPRHKDGSSGLSSAPTSPPHTQNHHPRQQHQHRRRRSDAGPPSPTDSELSQYTASSKTSLRDKLKSGERLLPHKRKAPKVESDDEDAESRKARRQRTNSAGLDSGRALKDRDAKLSSSKPYHDSRNRSISPQPRQHRRSASTQLASQSVNGLKKKRLPPPLQPTDYHSDDSSASNGPHPRSSKMRSLATPATADSNMSPIKVGPHKKHLDAHGQTFLARACARGEYDGAKQKLGDRPEDLNVADYAGNTPLQIASINGCEDIVKLLIDAGCNLDCVNYDKDTPLLDAVDNGHLGVVKLLLEAGVNPRKANVNGEEPIDRVDDDTENAKDIRAALMEARKRAGERRRTSEDRHSHPEYAEGRDSHAPDSPRQSPAATSSATARRGGTVRSTKTRNDLLYMPLDDKTLRQAAGRGDEETVARILQVKEGYDDPESMVAAARGGHDLVIQLLLGLGGANADPGPVLGLPHEFATPMLAAIGQENIKVVELLLEQQGFDPSRRFKGETYYEIARRRQGTNWKDEEHILKNAYDEHKRSNKDSKTKSPGRRDREREREEKRAKRSEARDESRTHKRNASSPTREMETKKKTTSSKLSSPKDKRRSDSFTSHGDEENQRRGPGRPASSKKDDRVPSINVSDREISPAMSHKPAKTKRTDSDATGVSSDGEAVKPRRKLVSKGELSREREKHKRSSMTSNSSLKEPSSPHESRNDDSSEKPKLSEKYHDRTKALKRDESRDHLSVSDGTSKRHRNSLTPDRPSDGDKEDSEAPVKRRRLDSEGSEKRQKRPVSSDGRPTKSTSRDGSAKPSATSGSKDRDSESKESRSSRDSQREKSIHVKSEDVDIDMPDLEPAKQSEKKKELLEREIKKEEERKQLAAEEKKKREEEEALKREAEEKRRKAEEDARKREEEEARKLREQREAEEAARREEEEKKRLEEEAKKKKEDDERKQREEEERLHKEQLEREAAEEARRQREEEERKERERRERAHREEMERKRAAREAEQRRIREEQEQARLDKLPPLLRWLDICPNPKIPAIAELFKHMLGVRYDSIRPDANQTPEGRELWVLNTHVALLLGEKDLDLSRYTAWERAGVSELGKKTLWRTEWPRYSLLAEKLWDIGRQLPGYYGDEDPSSMKFETREHLQQAAWDRFLQMNLFFVKASDLLYTVSNIPHLRNIKLAVEYRELLESESQAKGWAVSSKWKQDPDASRFHGFAPRNKYYVNGAFVGEDLPARAQISKTPFVEKRAPRRGLVQVFPDDPEYSRICLEQGLEHLVNGQQSPPLPNGIHSSSPTHETSATPVISSLNGTNGHAHDDSSTGANGEAPNGLNGIIT